MTALWKCLVHNSCRNATRLMVFCSVAGWQNSSPLPLASLKFPNLLSPDASTWAADVDPRCSSPQTFGTYKHHLVVRKTTLDVSEFFYPSGFTFSASSLAQCGCWYVLSAETVRDEIQMTLDKNWSHEVQTDWLALSQTVIRTKCFSHD